MRGVIMGRRNFPFRAKRESIMAGNKTVETDVSVDRYFSAIEDPLRREACKAIAAMMSKASKHPPKMWGTAIVGFGSQHHRYETGREGDIYTIGFSSRKVNISLYLAHFPEREALLAKLGKHKTSKGCPYINSLADVDLKVFEQLLEQAVKARSET